MNGAAMNCRQEQVLRSQHQDSSGLRSPGYHLQINHPPHQNSHPQHSKALSYKSDPFVVDGSADHFQHTHKYSYDGRCKSTSGEAQDPRIRIGHSRAREPIELPVPRFKIDENYVGEPPVAKDMSLVEISKDLDLDTRIDLLIKSKALAGMHPIFSELDQSDESSSDSDISFTNKTRSKQRHNFSPPPARRIPGHERFDDPEKPLSRPPSPFLSRATYLFWFNKAIELKQQAKEQEQALLEKAAKKLIKDNYSVVKTNQTQNTNLEKKPRLGNLLDAIRKELKVIVKEEFIKEVIENTAFNTLEDWWEKQRHLREEKMTKQSSAPSEVKSERPLSSPTIPGKNVDSNSKTSVPVVETMSSVQESCLSPIKKDVNKSDIKIIVEKTPHNANSFSDILSDNKMLENKSCQETSLSEINSKGQTTDDETSSDHISSLSFLSTCLKVQVKTDGDLVPTLNNSSEVFVDTVDKQTNSSPNLKTMTHREPSTLAKELSSKTDEVSSKNDEERLKCLEFSVSDSEKVSVLGQKKTGLVSPQVPNQNTETEDKDCIQDKENIPSQLKEDTTFCKDKNENNHKEENTSDHDSNGTVCSNSLALSP